MPHTKLKIFSVIFIVGGACSLLAAACVAAAAWMAGEEFVNLMVADNLSEVMVKLLIPYTIVSNLAVGAAELFAGIAGIRFAGGAIHEKFCRIPAVILLVLFGGNLFLKMITWNPVNLGGALCSLAISGAYLVFVIKVEEYHNSRPPAEDTALFRLKQED